MDSDPWAEWDPDQAPDAVQLVVLVADQVMVELPPLTMALGPTLKLTLGAALEAATVTVVDCFAVPAGPEQVNV